MEPTPYMYMCMCTVCVLSAGVIDAKDIVDDEDDSIRHKSILGRPQKQQAADSDSDNDW